MAIKSLSIRIDDEMLDKLHVIADYEARSANGQIIILIRNCIEEFKKERRDNPRRKKGKVAIAAAV